MNRIRAFCAVVPGIRALCDAPANQAAEPDTKRDGRWGVYSGVEMTPHVPGLNDGNGVRLVIDLATLTAPPTLTALREHCEWDLLGRWDAITIDPAKGVEMDLHLTRPANDQEAQVLYGVLGAIAHIRNKVPFKASVGAEAGPDGTWELIPQGATATVNGRTFEGNGDLPLYVLRGGVLFETSLINLFPADRDTGRVAARRAGDPIPPIPPNQPEPKESTMKVKDMKALLKKFPVKLHARIAALAADDKSDEEIDDTVSGEALAALQAENEQLKKDLAASQAETASAMEQVGGGADGSETHKENQDGPAGSGATARQAPTKPAPAKPGARVPGATGTGVAFAGAGGAGRLPAPAAQPATFMQAMRQVGEETKLTGERLHAATCAKFPDLDPNKDSPVRAAMRAAALRTAV